MSSCSILLVDDGEELRDLLRHVLERAGHLVTCAKNGIDASLVITGGSFDVVVTDMLMPERNGFELIAEIKENYPTVKIVAISGGVLIGRDEHLPMARGGWCGCAVAKALRSSRLVVGGGPRAGGAELTRV